VDIGSVTQSTAAAARAASAALPPRSSTRSPARVAAGWLVATIASAATAEGRAGPRRKAIAEGSQLIGARRGTGARIGRHDVDVVRLRGDGREKRPARLGFWGSQTAKSLQSRLLTGDRSGEPNQVGGF